MTTTPLPKPSYKRGDIVLVLLPNSDLRTAKLRPALVIQSDNLETGLSQTIVAMVTSKMLRAGYSSRVTVLLNSSEGKRSGLLTDSVVMTDNRATITNHAIDRVIGMLPMAQVDAALRITPSL